jgi:hypothetical protein
VLAFFSTETWIVRSTIQDNGQANVNASELCGCEGFANINVSDSAVVRYGASNALETVTDSNIRLYSNNAVSGGQIGPGIISFPLQ